MVARSSRTSRSAPEPIRTLKALRQGMRACRLDGQTIGLVPTMGALHDGHLALVRLAKKKADRVVVSIYVNPKQFAPHEDFGRYPRDEAGDRAKLATAGADFVWLPDTSLMYPDGHATRIVAEGAALGLETDFRPHFFGGVTTVVAKLFNQVTPDVAIFGEKDFQQLVVIRQMVRDLDMPLSIVAAPTARESDGLALSSRNAYLTAEERTIAPALNRAIREAARRAKAGEAPDRVSAAAAAGISAAGFASVDYVAVRDAATLGPYIYSAGRPGRVLAAAWLGKTRLIDNVKI